MPEPWTGELVGTMHVWGVTNQALAGHLGCTKEYVSMVLNGKRNPKGAKERFKRAVSEIVAEKEAG